MTTVASAYFFSFLAVTMLLTKDSKAYPKASSVLQLSTQSILTSPCSYNDNYCSLYLFSLLAVTVLLTKDSKVCYKTSSILQLSTLSVLTLAGNYNDYYRFNLFLLILSCSKITDRALKSLSQDLKYFAALQTINFNFGL